MELTTLHLTGQAKYAYQAGGQLLTEDGPWASDTVTNTYSNRLRTALRLLQPTGAWTNVFVYDAARRLTNVTSPAGVFRHQYRPSLPSTLISQLSLPNSSYITNDYDNVARLTATHLRTSTGVLTNKHEYIYNVGNQRTQQVFSAGSTYHYKYDAIGQLKVADSATASEDRGYVYDAAWNLNYRTNNATLQTFKVDGLNQLSNAVGSACKYDSNGNLTNYAGSIFYTYDAENQLAAFEQPNSVRSVFTYDGRGRLRQRQDYTWTGSPYFQFFLSGTVRYVYDGMRVIYPMRYFVIENTPESDGGFVGCALLHFEELSHGVKERNDSNTPTVSYTRGTDLSGSMEGAGGIGGLLGRSHSYSGGNWGAHNFYHADGNGNVTFMLNSSQAMVARYRYDPFGNTISSSGSLASANVYRFSSKEYLASPGIYYYGYRWYDPNLQRWVNRDPIEELGGINLYAFAGNNPVNLIDPEGYSSSPTPCEEKDDGCPDFQSQWPKDAAEAGPKVPDEGMPGGSDGFKTVNCGLALVGCRKGCNVEYMDDSKCLKKCKADCNNNFKKCEEAKKRHWWEDWWEKIRPPEKNPKKEK